MMRPVLAVVALLLSAPSAVEPAARTFGGWIAGCDNENVCTAIRPVWDAIDGAPAAHGTPFLQIRHHPHRDATPEITLIDQSSPAPDAVLKPPLAKLEILFAGEHGRGEKRTFSAQVDGKGGYRFQDEEARSILYGLRIGRPVWVSIGAQSDLALDTANLNEALAHFDRQQELEGTPGALVLRPDNAMFDYAHPRPPEAETIELSSFTQGQMQSFLAEYPKKVPGEVIEMASDQQRGLLSISRFRSPDRDCGVRERWGHTGAASEFSLVERREMPVCNGIGPLHWIVTHRADAISPEQK